LSGLSCKLFREVEHPHLSIDLRASIVMSSSRLVARNGRTQLDLAVHARRAFGCRQAVQRGDPPPARVAYDRSRPDLRGFDIIAFVPASRAVLDDMAARCDRLGIGHSGVQDTPAGPRLDVPDPDGTVLRFYHFTDATEGFTGVETRDGRHVGSYHIPQLQ
jgi:hypothetical protein